MFHLELRQFPHVARAFNLDREQLETRILRPWARGEEVEFDHRRWEPGRAKLAIYEGRALATDEIGMGRGWANAGRTGEEVTQRLLAEAQEEFDSPPALAQLKRALLARCAESRLGAWQVVELAGEGRPGARASERLALAEQAVWELLHEGKLRLLRGDGTLERDEWQPALLSWRTWTGAGPDAVFVEGVLGSG